MFSLKLINKISNNVRSYVVLENSFLWNNSLELHKSECLEDFEILKSPNSLQEIKYEEPYFYINDSIGNCYIGITDMQLLNNLHVKRILGLNTILVSYEGGTNIYDLKSYENKRLLDFKIFTFQVANDMLFYVKDFEIIMHDLSDNLFTWSYLLKVLGLYSSITNEEKNYEVRKFLGIYDNKLIIQLTNATLLFLDINNGDVKQLLQLNKTIALSKGVFYDDNFPPYIANNYLVWLNNQRLLKIDLDSYEIEIIKDYFNVPKEEQFRFMHSTYFEDKIYFVADYGWQYVTPSRVGVMDVNTGGVIWQQQLEKTGGLPEPPKVTKDKLYIRTAKGEIYIFEKESYST